MKTNAKTNRENRVQQVVLKSLAVLISLVLVSYTINAQGMWKTVWENASLAMEDFTADSHSSAEEVYATANTEAEEAEMELETWMTSATHFEAPAALEADAELELESWMTDANYFAAVNMMETETDNILELESWMTDASFFAANSYLETETENALQLEDWMTSDNFGLVSDSLQANRAHKAEKAEGKNELAENVSVETKEGKTVVKATNFTYRAVEEPVLKFERWMFDSKHFKAESK